MRTMPRVAFQGELGAFSEEAVLTYFQGSATPLPCKQFTDVAAAVQRGEAEYGLLPIENTTVGGVVAACDVLAQSTLQVAGEVICLVRHCLLASPGSELESVRRVLSHPVALGQCERFFLQHPAIEAVAAYDTAGAALQVAQTAGRNLAAIASRRAAERYGLVILLADIQDRDDNQTRFLIVTRNGLEATKRDAQECKTALLLETENRPGALVDALLPLAEQGINLTNLQSRPGSTPWSYRFFLEVEGDPLHLRKALERLDRPGITVRDLGSFARWDGRC